MAKILARVAPDDAGDRANALMAMVQTELFEAMLGMEEAVNQEDKIARIAVLNKVAKNIATLTRASVARNKHAIELREKVLLEAANRVESAAQARGMNKEEAGFWRQQVLMGL